MYHTLRELLSQNMWKMFCTVHLNTPFKTTSSALSHWAAQS